MQFVKQFKTRIRAGEVTVTFRHWRSPQAKVGGNYRLHPEGAVRVTHLDEMLAGSISTADAGRAGFPSPDAIRKFLKTRDDQTIYRVEFEYVEESARQKPTPLAFEEVVRKLENIDRRSGEHWTTPVLSLIDAQPQTRAGDLAPNLGWQTPKFKNNVRKLKKLGLTSSFEVGYALTDLGKQVLGKREEKT